MISIDMTKAKDIAHKKRRAARAEEFKPYDEVIMKQIPGADAQQAEAARQLVREKYAQMQNAIDESSTVEQIKAALETQ
jgi:hypothetical protein